MEGPSSYQPPTRLVSVGSKTKSFLLDILINNKDPFTSCVITLRFKKERTVLTLFSKPYRQRFLHFLLKACLIAAQLSMAAGVFSCTQLPLTEKPPAAYVIVIISLGFEINLRTVGREKCHKLSVNYREAVTLNT